VPRRDHFALLQLIRGLDVQWGHHEIFMSRLLSQLAVEMIDKRAGINATMQRLERCESVALGRRLQICDLLQLLPGEGPTPYRRFVDPIDTGIARLRSRKAMAAINGVLSAIHER
jgi:hypothetical protein